jgi:uncharacterized protein (TIGR02145 family)
MRHAKLFILILLIAIIFSCIKFKELASLTSSAITSINLTSAVSGGKITADGGSTVTARGTCWAITATPTISNSKTSDGTGTGGFISNLTGLLPGTLYHLRAYATNSVGTAYGNDVSFTTTAIAVPVLTTTAVTSITLTSATSGGNIASDGGGSITARGSCWATTANPSITNSKTTDGTGTGVFVSSLTGLLPGVTYHIRAYATNSAGTAYGDDHSFTTTAIVLPTLTTTAASSVSLTTATSGGNVTVDGGGAITSRGTCWATITGPTVSGSKTIDGTGSGVFSSNLTGLLPGTTYYARAYATNSAGTAYGNEVTFTTTAVVVPSLTTATVTSITLTTAVSGGTITSNGGSFITVSGICWSTTANPTSSGSHTTDGTTSGSYSSSLTGLLLGVTYHVRAYATNSAGTAYGNDLSFTTGTTIPTITTSVVSPITTTTAVSGGTIISDGGSTITVSGICWSTTTNPLITGSHTTDGATSGSFSSNMTGLLLGTTYHVRAYATNGIGTAYGNDLTFTTTSPPTVTTTAISGITQNTAISGGNVISAGSGTVTARGVCWGMYYDPELAYDTHTTEGSGTGVYTSSITGLTPGTTYHVRAYATNNAGTAYGSDLTFTVPQWLTDVDGNIYKTVQIGTQVWMAENLKTTKYSDNTTISPVTDNTAWAALITPGYCWYNNDAATNKVTYGALYNWYTVDPASNGGKNVCPTGWHVPSDPEWTTLTSFLGGESAAGDKLKEIGTTHWKSPNTGTNETGFTALPGGSRDYDGIFGGINNLFILQNYCGWWSSSEYSTTGAWSRSMYYNDKNLYVAFDLKKDGFSIRCLKN